MAAATKVSLKLKIDTKAQRVLYAEADKKAIDFLFHFFDFPRGSVLRLLNKQGMVGCLGNLYDSIENLSEKISYRCNNISGCGSKYTCFSDEPGSICPCCGCLMSFKMTYVAPTIPARNKQETSGRGSGGGVVGGFVKDGMTYMLVDDLVVEPMSTIPSIDLLTKFNVTELGPLEEKVVDLTLNEAMELMKKSFTSNTVLTSVFLKKNMAK